MTTSSKNFEFNPRLVLMICCFLAINANVFSQLSGTYTIGGTMPDYPTFSAAVEDLVIEGLGGPVVFNVRDGYYEEQFSLPPIANSSEVNSITFQSENADAALVEIAFAASSMQFYTVELAGCSYVYFHELTFSALDPVLAHVISTAGAQFIWFEECVFNGTQTPCSDPETGVLIYTQFISGSDHWMLLNNEFNYSCFALELWQVNNWVIEGNNFANANNETMMIGGGDGMTVRGNTSSDYSTMYFSDQSGLQILANNWNGNVVFDGPSGTALNHTLIANNFFYGSEGLYLVFTQFLDVIGNSFYNSNSCIYAKGGSELNFVNNILASYGGKAIDTEDNTVLESCYSNDIFTVGADYITWNETDIADLDEWQNSTGYGVGSISVDPEFVSYFDLHVCNPALDAIGIPFPELNWDIDFEPRDALTPDIGADEFNLDVCECTLSAEVSITSNYNGEVISCYGEMDGSALCEATGATGEVTFDWSSGSNTAEAMFLGSGEHTCTVTDDFCSVEVSVFLGDPQPVNAIIFEILDPTCPDGNNGQVTSLGNGGTMDFTYSWAPSGGSEATGEGLMGGVEYTVSIEDSNGCLATESITLEAPEVPEVFASNDIAICQGTTATIWASGGETYEWSGSLGDTWEIEVSPDITTTYVVTGYNADGCSAQDEMTVTVLQLPEVSIDDFDPSDVCIDVVPIALPNVNPAGGAVTGSGVDGEFFDPELSGVGVHELTYTYSDASGCSGSATTEIVVHDIPTVTLEAFDPDELCIDSEAVDLPVGSPAGGNYNGQGVSGGQFDPASAGLGTHDISYIFTDEFSCYSWDIQQITIHDIPEVTLDNFSVDSLCTSDAAVPLPIGSPSGGQFSGEGVLGNGFDPAEAGPGIHVISYAYEDDNGCSSFAETSIHVFDCTSIAANQEGLDLIIYPNPAQDSFTLQIPVSAEERNTICIINSLGEVVWKDSMNGQIYLAEGLNLENGMYIVQVSATEGMYQARIVLQ